MTENFYEKMHLDMVEADNFEPPYDPVEDFDLDDGDDGPTAEQ